MKTTEDFQNRAFFLLTVIAKEKLDVSIKDGRVVITPKPGAVKTIASDLLEIYSNGWDDRSIAL